MTTLLDGKAVANSLLNSLKGDVEQLKSKGVSPKLVVVLVGEDPASQVYVGHKQKACAKIGVESVKLVYPETTSQEELLEKIEELNADDSVHGVIVQLPLPKHIDSNLVIETISPAKDVDGFHALNVGRMVQSHEWEDMAPCTPKGMMRILEHYEIDVTGMDAVVIGRSNIVGKPVGNMLLNRAATVTVTHRRTKDLARYTKEADLIVVAVGKPNLLTADMVKEGVIVLDVGINRLENGKLVGDADFDGLQGIASYITPVPGGVGPMTVACLLENTVTAAKKSLSL